MRSRNLPKPRLGTLFQRFFALSLYSATLGLTILCPAILCYKTWAAGPPSLQIAGDSSPPAPPPDDFPRPDKFSRIAIIIDDLGYNLHHGTEAALLPGAVTLSILPYSPYSRNIAEAAAKQHKEIMLHAPMSSIWDKPLDPGGLTVNMEKEDFIATLSASLEKLPNIQGLNNHMGSQLTQESQPMTWLMEELRQRDLYFVDSRTIASSLAWETALNYGVPTTRRDVFLDNDTSYPAITRQFEKLLAIAKRRGQALAIAHPYPETLQFLETALPMLEQHDIRLVPVSDLLSSPQQVSNSSYRSKGVVDSPREVVGLINYLAK